MSTGTPIPTDELETSVPESIGTVIADCNEPVEPEEQEAPCPDTCTPDPNAPVQNWTRATEPFLNRRTCRYSVSVKTEFLSIAVGEESLLDPYKAEGVQELLDFYGKALSYEDDQGVERNSFDVCLEASEIASTFIDTRPFVKMKVLVTVPASVFDMIPLASAPENQPDTQDMPAYVSIKSVDFFRMINNVARAMEIHGVKYAVWVQNEGGKVSDPNFDPIVEADRIREFKKQFRDFVRANGFTIRTPAPFGRRMSEELEIGFTDEMRIEYVKAAEISCDLEQITRSFASFTKTDPQTLQRTMYYVSKLPDMWTDVTAVEPLTWDQFFLRYTAYPPLEIASGEEFISNVEIDPVACALDDLDDPINNILNGVVDGIVSLPDAFADRFSANLCLDLQGIQKQDVDFSDLEDITKRSLDAALREVLAGDNVLEAIPELLKKVDSLDELWTEVLDKLEFCGLLSLMSMGLECLFAGLTLEDALKPMVKAAVNAMGKPVFELLMIGLPEDAKVEIRNQLSDEFKDIPPPWEAGYREGSYSGMGNKVSVDATYQGQPTNELTGSAFRGPTTEQLLEGYGDLQTSRQVNTTLTGQDYYGQFYGGGGSIGMAAGNVQEAMFDAYKEAFFNAIDENLIDLDIVMEQLNQLPGAEIIARAFSKKDCPAGPPLFTPPIDEFLKTLELDFCRGHFAITLPKFNKLNVPDIWKIIISTAKEILYDLIVEIIILAITMILELLLNLLCKLLATVGALATEALTGGNDFRGALSEALCGEKQIDAEVAEANIEVGLDPLRNIDPTSVDAAVGNILESLGLVCVEDVADVPSALVANNFINTVSALITNSELLDLLEGNASDATLGMIADVVSDQIPELECSLGQPSSIAQFFKGFGGIINKDTIEKAMVITDDDMPAIRSICASPSELAKFNNLRCSLLASKGLSESQCQQQIQELTDRAKQDLENLAKMATEGILPESAIPNILGDDPIDPDCPTPSDLLSTKSLLPTKPESMANTMSTVQRSILQTIEDEYNRDLMDRRGFLNMVLSDSEGRGYKGHGLLRDFLGDRKAADLGIFEFYTDDFAAGLDGETLDDATQWHGGTVSGSAPLAAFGSKIWNPKNGLAAGGYPMYVGSLTQLHMLNYGIDRVEAGGLTPSMLSGSAPIGDNLVKGWAGNSVKLGFTDYEEGDKIYATEIDFKPTVKDATDDRSRITIIEKFGGEPPPDDDPNTIEYEVVNEVSGEVAALIQSLEIEDDLETKTLPVAAFSKYIKNVVLEASDGTAPVSEMDSFLENLAYTMPDLIMRNIAFHIATGPAPVGSDRISKEAQSFKFGFNSGDVPRLVIMAGPEVDDDFAIDNNRDGGFTSDDDPDDLEAAQATFDEDIYERFGGNEKNPPYYIKEPKRDGWLGLMDKLIPEWDACDPVDGSGPVEPIVNFDDLADNQNKLSDDYLDDERLSARPSSQCAWAKPYSEIFSKTTAAGVDTAIYATIRIYVVETLLKGLPVLSMFGPETYDLIFANYVAQKMERDLKTQGVWGLPSKKYYYKFMEQVVQMFGRQMDAGLIEPTSIEREAVNNLNKRQIDWSREQPNGINKAAYMKSLYEEVEGALDEESEGNPGIRVLLSRLVLQEIARVSEIFADALDTGNEEMIKNIHTDLFLKDRAFCQGAIGSGFAGFDPWDGEVGGAFITEAYQKKYTVNSWAPGSTSTNDDRIAGYTPFRLETYIRVVEKDGGTGFESFDDRPDIHRGVLTSTELAGLLTTYGVDDQPLSSLFSSVRIGMRLCLQTPDITDTVAVAQITNSADPLEGAFKASMSEISDKVMQQEKAFTVQSSSGVQYVIPLAAAEIDYEGEIFDEDDYYKVVDANLECLARNLSETAEYKMLFETCIPLKKMVSLLSIYSVTNFLPSLGWAQDGWNVQGGRWMGFFSGFRTWNRKTFEDSKNQARRVFLSYYHGQDPEYVPEELKNAGKNTNRKKIDIELDIAWWRFGGLVRKPTDKNGVLCP